MSTEKTILIVSTIIIFFVYYIISSMLKHKGIRENNKEYSKFLDELIIGDRVALSSGISGMLREKNERGYSVEISKGIIIEVLPSSITGRS